MFSDSEDRIHIQYMEKGKLHMGLLDLYAPIGQWEEIC